MPQSRIFSTVFLTICVGSIAFCVYADILELQSTATEENPSIKLRADSVRLRKNTDPILYPREKPSIIDILPEEELTDFQKESIESIRTLSLQFILIAVGVFSLTGIYLLKTPTQFKWIGIPFIIIVAYILFGLSIYYGYRIHGNIIYQLEGEKFDSFDAVLVRDGKSQFWLFFAAGFTFIGAILVNFIISLFRKDDVPC
jgi:hypothetical protein